MANKVPATPRKPRSDGMRSRDAILNEATRLATVEGIGGLSIARLADAVGMSKSGLFAHFGSKAELQLATIETASRHFDELVFEPALAVSGGLARLRALTDRYLEHVVVSHLYPGGCFFSSVAAELDTQPGPVRDSAMKFLERWLGELERAIRDAQTEGDIDKAADPALLTFQVEAYMMLANAQFVIMDSKVPVDQARRAVKQLLADATPN